MGGQSAKLRLPIEKMARSASGASLAGASMAAAAWAALAGASRSARSHSVTSAPRSVSRQPMNRPIRPAPAMATRMASPAGAAGQL